MNLRFITLYRVMMGALLTLLFIVGSSFAAESGDTVTLPAGGVDVAQSIPVSLTLKDLGHKSPLRLLGAEAASTTDFSFHTLDVVSSLKLRMNYSYSPFLDFEKSFLSVNLNGKEVAKLQLQRSNASADTAEIEINPLLLEEWNHLSFQFVAQLDSKLCSDPRHPQLWIQLNHIKTALVADTSVLPLVNDLALFPVPFFDKHDTRDLQLPFVLTAHPLLGHLKSAGILASWFGGLADWRKAKFPTYLDQIPDQNAIVLLTEKDHIQGLEIPALVDGYASISSVINPRNPQTSLLLIVGRDEESLVEAAKALTLGQVPLVGSSQTLSKRITVAKHNIFDAPNWLPTNKKVRIGDFVAVENLSATGLFVTPLQMVLKLPPLYRSTAGSFPITLKLESSNNTRYLTRVDGFLNGVAFQNVAFDKPANNAGEKVQGIAVLNVPTVNLTGRDTVVVKFTFIEKGHEVCTTGFVKDKISVSPESTVDLSGVSKYMVMPDLSYLAYMGFPYSKYADLSETVVLLPKNPDRFEIEGMLNVLGHVGNKTNVPVTGVTIASVDDAKKFVDKDILVVGTPKRLASLLTNWSDRIPVNLLSDSQPFPAIGERFVQRVSDWFSWSEKLNAFKKGKAMVMVGFESPLKSGRSVIAVTANDSSALSEETSVLNSFIFAKDFSGDVVAIKDTDSYDRVMPFNRGSKYYLGELTLMERAQNFVHHNLWLALLGVIMVALFFAAIFYQKLKRISQSKLR